MLITCLIYHTETLDLITLMIFGKE